MSEEDSAKSEEERDVNQTRKPINNHLYEFKKSFDEFLLDIKFLEIDIRSWLGFSSRAKYLFDLGKEEGRLQYQNTIDNDFSSTAGAKINRLYGNLLSFEILFGGLNGVPFYKELKKNLELSKSLTDSRERHKACNEVLSYSSGFITALRQRYERRGFEPESEEDRIKTKDEMHYLPKGKPK